MLAGAFPPYCEPTGGGERRGEGMKLNHLGFDLPLRSANLCVRAKLNRGAVSLGTDASRRATELRSPAAARYWKEKGHHPWWPKSLLEETTAPLTRKDAVHNPNNRIAIGALI